MLKDIISARLAGYEYGLRHPYPQDDYITDGACVEWYGQDGPVPDALEKAWYKGLSDSKFPDWQDYCSPDAAASVKGVAPNTIYRILADDRRRAQHFPQAIFEEVAPSGRWHIHFEDLAAWEPSRAGRKRKERA